MATRVMIDVPPRPNGHAMLRLAGEIDISDAEAVRRALIAAVRTGPAVIVDLAEVSFIDLAGVRALRDARDAAGASGCRLLLASPPRFLRRLVDLMDLPPLPFGEDGGPSDGDGPWASSPPA